MLPPSSLSLGGNICSHKSLSRPTVFKTASRAPTEGWSRPDDFRSKLRELESNQHHDVQSIASYRSTIPQLFSLLLPPCAHMPSGHVSSVASSGGRNRTYGLLIQSQASLPTATTPEWIALQKCPAGVEPGTDWHGCQLVAPAWKAGTSAARSRAQTAEGEGVEPSRLIARLFSRQLPSPIGLPFRSQAAVAGIEPAK